MLAFDCKPLRDRSRRMDVHLDGVYTNEAALVAELERKLGGRVAYLEITEVDLCGCSRGRASSSRRRG
jgi:hypothetical protein